MRPPATLSAPRLAAAALLALGLGAGCAARATTEAPPPGPAAQKPKPLTFDLMEFRVEGSTVLPQEAVEQAVYPYLGPRRTLADVEHARAALQSLYQSEGFATVSVTIPRQHVSESDGVVVLQAIERKVGRLRVVGAHYFLPSEIKRQAPSLAPGTVPNMHQVRRDLIALNAWPDREVQPALHAGREPNTMDVDLDVTDSEPIHGSLEVNNRYNSSTHAERLSASLSDNNMFQRGDSANIAYQVAPEDVADAEVVSASYLFRVPDSDVSVLFSYLHSNSNVLALGVTDVVGRGSTAGFRVLIPISSGADFSDSVTLGWDYKRFFELDTFKKSSSGPTSAPVTYYPVSAAYAAGWTRAHSTTDLNVSLEFGLPPAGSDDAGFGQKAYHAASTFAILRASAARTQDLPYGAQAYASVTGQLTNDSLVSSEQMALGGVDSVRGYLEAEALGDYGAYAQTELRSPSIGKYIGHFVDSWRFHLFYDAGAVWLNNALSKPGAGSPSTYGLQSAGVGTRIKLWGHLNGVLQDATVFNKSPYTKPGTNRVLFRVFGEF